MKCECQHLIARTCAAPATHVATFADGMRVPLCPGCASIVRKIVADIVARMQGESLDDPLDPKAELDIATMSEAQKREAIAAVRVEKLP